MVTPRLRSLGWTFFLAAVSLAVVAGCSGPPQTATDDGDGGPREQDGNGALPTPRASVADFETFDATKYPVPSPKREVKVTHNVPTSLMSSRADEGVTQTVQGFRIQVYSAQDKQASEEFREEVRQWWAEVKGDAPSDLFSTEPPIVIEYSQPYYRVRFGAFADRERAEEALQFVRNDYPDAFMARSTVTIRR